MASPPGKWLTGLCDCFAEGCCGVCCAVCWCPEITTGQLYQRINGGNCLLITIFLFILWGAYILLVVVSSIDWRLAWLANVASLCSMFAFLIMCAVVCKVRKAIRKRDGIAAENCSEDCEDCCCACWCGPCTQCQIFRQEEINCAKYQICSKTATTNV